MRSDSPDRVGLTRTLAETHPSAAQLDQSLARGSVVGRYVLLDRIGAGGMGVVMAAYDPELDRKVAIKVMHAQPDAAASEGRARMIREAQALARLSHPNVVTIHDVGTYQRRVFLAMEYVDGETLTQWYGGRSWREIVAVLAPVAGALAAIHAAGMVHRDVKPDNIMIDRSGRPRLMDLGLARAESRDGGAALDASAHDVVSQVITRRGALAGTPAYMAPEQHLAGGGDARSDQFAFGVTLYEALWRERPFVGDSLPELANNVIEGNLRLPARERDVPSWLRDAVLQMLALEPTERFPSMDAVAHELLRDRGRLGVRAGVVTMVAVGGFAAWFAGRDVGRSCDDADAPVRGVWGPSQREAVRGAITKADVGYTEATAERAVALLDRWVDDWAVAERERCEAARAARDDDRDLALRQACLARASAEFGALVEVLGQPGASVAERALPAVLDLPQPSRCSDPEYLAARADTFVDDDLGRHVGGVRQRLLEAKALERAGAYTDGVTLAQEVVSDARALGDRAVLAESELRLGSLYNLAGRYADAERELIAAHNDARWSRHDGVAIEAAVLLTYVIGVNGGRFDEGLFWYRLADAELGPSEVHDELRADLLSNIGTLHMHRRSYPEALSYLEQAIALGERTYGSDSLRVARYRISLVPTLGGLGQADRALALAQDTVAQYERTLGSEHPTIASALNNLGTTYYGMGRLTEAVDAFTRAFEIQRRALGLEHPAVATTANNVGAISHLLGRDADAYRYYEIARAGMMKSLPADHLSIAAIEFNLGTAAARAGRNDEALAHHQRAREIRVARLGERNAEVAMSDWELVSVLLALGRLDEAQAAATRLEQFALGDPASGMLAHARASQGMLARARGDRPLAIARFEEAHAIFEGRAKHGAVDGDVAFALAELHWPEDPTQARALAELAQQRYADLGAQAQAQRARVQSWLAAHP